MFKKTLLFMFVSLVMPFSFALDFEFQSDFPAAAEGAYGVVMTAGPDGRLILWDGQTVWRQTLPGGDGFSVLAQGYVGDPGFIALSPDNRTLLLGAGMSGNLYLLHLDAPQDYSGRPWAIIPHYWGVFLSDTLIVLDKTTDDYATVELVVVDITADTPFPKSVMRKPDVSALAEGEFAASTAMVVSPDRKWLYTSALKYVLEPYYIPTGYALKRIAVADLLSAYTSKAMLDWETDAKAIGGETDFSSVGPAAINNDGQLLMGGFGTGVLRVDPETATVTETYSPVGATYYSVAYNPADDSVIIIASDPVSFATDDVLLPVGAIHEMPLSTLSMLLFLIGVFMLLGYSHLVSDKS